MATAAKTYTFTTGATILASEANTNYDDLVDFANQETIHKDASVAFTAVPSGPATDPSSDNQLARKAYVDNRYRKVRRMQDANDRNGIDTTYYSIPSSGAAHTYVTGRVYRFSAKLNIDITSGAGYLVSVVNGSTEVLRLAQDNGKTGSGIQVTGFSTSDTLSGALTLNLAIKSAAAGTLNVSGATIATEFLVEDLGV